MLAKINARAVKGVALILLCKRQALRDQSIPITRARKMPMRRLLNKVSVLAKDSSSFNNILRYNSFYYPRILKYFRKALSGSEDAGSAADELLRRALAWARETTYGKRFGPNLEDWPVISKTDLSMRPEHFRRRASFSVPASTGGSTGRPLRLWRSLECIAAEQALVDSLLGNAAPMQKRRVAVLRADYVKSPADKSPPFGVWRNGRRWLVLSNAHLTRSNLSWFVDTLSAFQPEILWVYPTALSNLLHLMRAAGTTLTAPIVLSSSEVMSVSLFLSAERTLQARVIDLYGHGERVCSAYGEAVQEYRFHRAYGHVELIPLPAGRAGSPMTARIIATGYWNSAFPLVRYDTGDYAILPDGSDADSVALIAKGQRPFLGIVGRVDDYVLGRDGEKITGMNHIPRELDGVFRIQIIQDSLTKVRILALSNGELTVQDRRMLEQNARELLPPYMDLEIECVTKLLALPNGKTPFIVRKEEEEDLAAV